MKNSLSIAVTVFLACFVGYLVTSSNDSDIWDKWVLTSPDHDTHHLISVYADNDDTRTLALVILSDSNGIRFSVFGDLDGQTLLGSDIKFVNEGIQYNSEEAVGGKITFYTPADNAEILQKLFLPSDFKHGIKITWRFDQSEVTIARPLDDMSPALDKLLTAQLQAKHSMD